MLRIGREDERGGASRLRLQGRVVGPWVEELRRACAPALQAREAVVLDLADVAFIDREGLDLFRALVQAGVQIVHCSPFVAEQLRAVSPGVRAVR